MKYILLLIETILILKTLFFLLYTNVLEILSPSLTFFFTICIAFFFFYRSYLTKNRVLSFLISSIFFVIVSTIIIDFKIYRITSSSMFPSIQKGDLIIAKKIGNDNSEFFGFKTNRNVNTRKYKFQRGDVLVFSRSEKNNIPLIKRCIALPGDTIKMENGVVFVNGSKLWRSWEVRQKYNLYSNNYHLIIKHLRRLKIDFRWIYDRRKAIEITIDPKNLQQISLFGEFDSVVAKHDFSTSINHSLMDDTAKQKSLSNFGPILIPYAGLNICQDNSDLRNAQQIKHNRKILNELTINYKKVDTLSKDTFLCFPGNYVFFLGDNRSHSVDSRTYGVICEKDVVAVATGIIFPNKFSRRIFFLR